jgi:hypothetical protein
MPAAGVYGWSYGGFIGVGSGMFKLDAAGNLRGMDLGGNHYWGTIIDRPDGQVDISVAFRIPAGGWLVTGTSPADIDQLRSFEGTGPANLGDGTPFQIAVGGAPVWLIVVRIADDQAAVIDQGMTITIAPVPLSP